MQSSCSYPRALRDAVRFLPGCVGGALRPGSWWRSRKARASQYMAFLDGVPGDSSDSVARIATPPSSAVRSALPKPPETLMGWEDAGFWLMNSTRMSRYKPERKDPGGGSLDSSGGRRKSAGEDPGAAAPTPAPSHEPHWWQYEWPGGFSLAHRGQALVKVMLFSRGSGFAYRMIETRQIERKSKNCEPMRRVL